MDKKNGILFDGARIRARIRELALETEGFCSGEDFTVVWIKEGARRFLTDFLPNIKCPAGHVGISVSSYGFGRTPGRVEISNEIEGISAKRVLLLDDIIDSGHTASAVCKKLREQGVVEIRTCFLLSKPARRRVDFVPDHVGFEIPDVFVFGYGLDLDGGQRELDGIYFEE